MSDAHATTGHQPHRCRLDLAIKAIAGKWKPLVLRPLLLDGPQRYNDLLRAIPEISPKELTRNLRELAYAGLISHEKQISAGADISVYEVTSWGKNLLPVFQRLGSFGDILAEAKPDASPEAVDSRYGASTSKDIY